MAAMRSIADPPPRTALARFDPDFGQRFLLTVDTGQQGEEERPLARDADSHDRRLAKFQQFCEGEGIVPVYFVDGRTARSARTAETLRGPVAAGAAEIGMQLSSLTDGNFDEGATAGASSAGHAEIAALRDAIERDFEVAPAICRAGRYGGGPNSPAMLIDGGFAIDSSVRAGFDFSSLGGPDFHRHPLAPYWLDDDRRLLELPLTTVFWGLLRRQGQWLHPATQRIPRLRGLLARTGLLKRIPLTPEGNSVDEAICGIDIALDDELPLLVFMFRSLSLSPGQTRHVRNEEDLDELYDWWRRVFAYLDLRKVAPASVAQVMRAVQR
jgi:hypothetical protein